MAQNYSHLLPDVVKSSFLGDVEFGENINVDEHRTRSDFLGSRFCKVTYDGSKGVKSKKPSKKVSDSEIDSLADDTKRKMKIDEQYFATKKEISGRKENFDQYLHDAGGPTFQPVLFYSHPQKSGDDIDTKKIKRAQPPPTIKNTFAEPVLNNITKNLKAEYPVYAQFNNFEAKPFCLKKESTVEQAFADLLQPEKKNQDSWKKSEFADTSEGNWKVVTERLAVKNVCTNPRAFVVEYACILPEHQNSIVYLTCRGCGNMVQTVLNDNTWAAVKREIQVNIALAKHTTKDDNGGVSVTTIALPTRCVTAKDIYMVTCLIGETPLTLKNPTDPSCFFRVCMYVNCSEDSIIPEFIHGRIKRVYEVVNIEE